MMHGGCLCGQLRFELRGPPRCETLCHCNSCRRSAGAPAVAWLTVSRDDFVVLAGSFARYRSSPQVTRSFCGTCGTQITYEHDTRSEELDVTIASLDAPNASPPRDHTWCEDRLSWLKLADGLPTYPKTRDL